MQKLKNFLRTRYNDENRHLKRKNYPNPKLIIMFTNESISFQFTRDVRYSIVYVLNMNSSCSCSQCHGQCQSRVGRFLPREAMHPGIRGFRGTSHGPVSVSVSVCLSVTSRCSTKTAKRRITQTTPHDTPGSLVFW